MKLYKYCEMRFNPLNGCDTIMLNSTTYFRRNYDGEADLINDILEGRSIGMDKNNNRFENAQFQPEAYIFCSSIEKMEINSATNKFANGYDSLYCIKNKDKFLAFISKLAGEQFTEQHISPKSLDKIEKVCEEKKISKDEFINGLVLEPHSNPVLYRKGSYVKINDFFNVEEQFRISIFHKPPKYIDQKEYRFAFAIYHPKFNLSFDVSETPLLLKSELIHHYIKRP